MTFTERDAEVALQSTKAQCSAGALVAKDELDRARAEAARPVVEQDRAAVRERLVVFSG